METPNRKFGEWGQFDRYCKLVLYHEAIDYLREMQRRRDMEISLDELSPADWDKLSVRDDYPCESYIFHSHGYDLRIDNELVAEAFAVLPQQEQSILILHCVMELNDVQAHGNVQKCRTAPQDKDAERTASEANGNHAGGRLRK